VPGRNPDYGKIQQPGLFGRLVGREPKIVRDAEFDAAIAGLPKDSTIVSADTNSKWVVFKMPDGKMMIRFRAIEAWLPNEPTPLPNRTIRTLAAVQADGKVIVLEGLHRTRAVARARRLISNSDGGADRAPGWLDFTYDPEALRETPSTIAINEMLGGAASSAPLIPAK
jgi:hypothetical protein